MTVDKRQPMRRIGKALVQLGFWVSALGCWINGFHVPAKGDNHYCEMCRRLIGDEWVNYG